MDLYAAMTVLLLVVGGLFTLLGALGIVRLPDLFIRMQAATKASVLGASCLLLSLAFHVREPDITARSLAAIAFICLTVPVAAHMIGRAAYLSRAPLWENTILDELQGRYDAETRELLGSPSQEVNDSAAPDNQSADLSNGAADEGWRDDS